MTARYKIPVCAAVRRIGMTAQLKGFEVSFGAKAALHFQPGNFRNVHRLCENYFRIIKVEARGQFMAVTTR